MNQPAHYIHSSTAWGQLQRRLKCREALALAFNPNLRPQKKGLLKPSFHKQ